MTYSYTYDGNGNILSISDGTYTTCYVYDSANQLLRENNQAGGFTHTWEYDPSGNILNRKEYAYTTGALGTPTDTVTYSYDDYTWGDLLTGYDGISITYDEIGNPLSLSDGTRDYDWSQTGRELWLAGNSDLLLSFGYDANGMRTKKEDGENTYQYVYNGSSLSQMTVGNNTLYFAYGANGVPMSVTYNNVTYYYVVNIQGDIIAILNAAGTPVVHYSYDAWGNPISTTGTMASTLGTLNPLRYRGYVYDQELGLYYLQSRYYNPEWGRFLNADSFVSTGQGLLGNNMFAYCGNNPVCRYDTEGLFWESLVSGVLHAANNLAIAMGYDTAAIGAYFLMMEQDSNGVYHARFNCWQQWAGYNKIYDWAFDLGTSMVAAQFGFSYGGCGYTIWAWKGDYINLGAGAELGIYRGNSGHRTVDTGLAMWMGMIISYGDEWIINYFPDENQWWITGFNPKYQNVNANDLLATIGVMFNDYGMYQAFKNQWGADPRWHFWDDLSLAILQF